MRHAKLFIPIALALLLVAGSVTVAKNSAPAEPAKVTVGEFALKVVRLADDDSAALDSMSAEQALTRLKRAGLTFQGAAGDPITDKEKSSFFLAVANGLFEKMSSPPDGFEACAELPKTTDCRACCLALPGASNKMCGKACGRAHANLQVSPSEPTP